MPEKTLQQKMSEFLSEPEFPADLILCGLLLFASVAAIYYPSVNTTPIRDVLSIPVLLFIPGYCILAALFPKNDDIGLAERMALSFGLSLSLAALVGFGLTVMHREIGMDAIIVILFLIAVIMVPAAFFRRAFLPSVQRFRIPFSRIRVAIQTGLFPPESDRVDHLLSFILVLVIIAAISTTLYVIASPKESEHFSEFFILGENRMADEYPNQITAGLSYPMFIGVGNHEYRNMSYRIETWSMRTEFDTTTNTTTILAMEPVDSLSLVLSHNETMIVPYNLSVNKTGFNRAGFLLFNETIPDPDVTGGDRINASYRDLYLRITVLSG